MVNAEANHIFVKHNHIGILIYVRWQDSALDGSNCFSPELSRVGIAGRRARTPGDPVSAGRSL